ncbi:hypothetical protein BP5796_03655 [Coleophoma crateriformis]|uniref:Phosphoribosyltransferase domain-containing protein n=1 Tax=Coleophoma crateriformis TaxID=565419 RepID=A0A3D8SP56_9HELO|nr:hypothetical protein BP5796_03655 [Coleophoma crateriformis]
MVETIDVAIGPDNQTQPSLAGPFKAIVVGLYGVPGSGKTFLINQLKHDLGEEHFNFYEGSEVIGAIIPGGLDAFLELEEHGKVHWRQLAIDRIRRECEDSGHVGVVNGHFMFWPEHEEAGRPVYTANDLGTFTHILYLDIPADLVVQRRQADLLRPRSPVSKEHLLKWQLAEKAELRRLCSQNEILFFVLSSQHSTSTVSGMLRHFRQDTNEYNLQRAATRLDEVVLKARGGPETVLVLDADKTLAAEDTGTLFWRKATESLYAESEVKGCPLTALFSSPLGYSDTAFRQAVLLYEEIACEKQFDAMCEAVASSVTMHPEFVTLLQRIAEHNHVIAVVVTCGLRLIWVKVLKLLGLSKVVEVIGGGRITDGFIVTPSVKAALVARLRDFHHLYVWAFGDSVLDLPMMSEAHQSIVVVGEENTRSKTMDAALLNAVDLQGLKARQVLLPSRASPRLSTTKLPLVQLTAEEFVDSVLHRRIHQLLDSLHCDSAKLLMTLMRDASVSGPALREVHRRVGWYLAITFLPAISGLEQHPIRHVQGHITNGYRLQHEQQTSVVALMRGGEGMAFGINDAFPLAMFVHANTPQDVRLHHVQGQHTIVLVDSVVNSGKTVREFVNQIRKLHTTIRIVVVAGVVQAESALIRDANLIMVALRQSDNKFTGRGTTDTGNRLFNTTHLD